MEKLIKYHGRKYKGTREPEGVMGDEKGGARAGKRGLPMPRQVGSAWAEQNPTEMQRTVRILGSGHLS